MSKVCQYSVKLITEVSFLQQQSTGNRHDIQHSCFNLWTCCITFDVSSIWCVPQKSSDIQACCHEPRVTIQHYWYQHNQYVVQTWYLFFIGLVSISNEAKEFWHLINNNCPKFSLFWEWGFLRVSEAAQWRQTVSLEMVSDRRISITLISDHSLKK